MNRIARTSRILVEGLSFPEAPRWYDGALWFSDIHAHRIYRVSAQGALSQVAKLDDRVCGLGFMPDGRLLVVSMLDRKLISVQSNGALSMHADLSDLCGDFINDMVVDSGGRAYVGSRNGGSAESASDGLILVDPGGRCRVLVEDMVSPNGAVVTPDQKSLVVAETAVGRLSRFAIGPDGSVSARETLAEIEGRHIDGICLDASGSFWAGGGVGGLLRIGPQGHLIDTVEFHGRMVLACSLGGPDRKTLFLATTSTALLENLTHVGSNRELDIGVDSVGRIETLEVDVPGID